MTVGMIIAAGSFLISALTYFSNKAKMEKFESNCIATLNAKVDALMKQDDLFRSDIKLIFEKLDAVEKDISFFKGKFNGQSK